MSTNSNYSSIYSIKEFAIDQIAPKYFSMDEVNQLNIGLLGYTTELIANTTEDSFNAITMLFNEIFPNLAILPESIYNYASMFQLSEIFATPAAMDVYLFIAEDDILKNASRVRTISQLGAASTKDEDLFEFYLDSDMVIDLSGIQFMLDYDVKITYKPYRGDYIYTAMYDMNRYGTVYSNSVSSITNPYIRSKRIKVEGINYLMLAVKTHQMNRFIMNDTIISNDVVNLPTFTLKFDGQLAGFEAFYKEPGGSFIQLQKRMSGTAPIKEPFCYYKYKDDNTLEISFSSRDKYFQPKFNSELNIDYATSLGSKGVFPLYKDNDVQAVPSSDKYDYNNNISVFAIPSSPSVNGADKLTCEQLRNRVVECFSTVKSYTTENDLQLYFENFDQRFNSNILFIKKRDDIAERLFTAFTLFKNDNNDIYHTNTLHMEVSTDQFDSEYSQSDSYILKPGHLFAYKPGIIDTAIMKPGNLTNIDEYSDEQFLYTNPFLIYFIKNPTLLGYYLNSTDAVYVVDYVDVNENSFVQFICKELKITRNAIENEDSYKIQLTVTPTVDTLDNPIVDEILDGETHERSEIDTGNLIIRMVVESNGHESAFTDLKLTSWNLKAGVYTFEGYIKTDDYITVNNDMRVYDMYSMESTPGGFNTDPKLIPMFDCKINFYTWYKYKDATVAATNNDIAEGAPLSTTGYTFTNKYSTDTNRVTFIYPIKMMKSNVLYSYNGDGTFDSAGRVIGGTYNVVIKSTPLIEAKTMADPDVAKEFYEYLSTQYNYISDILDEITNNFSVDVKFYNTFGKSKNFRVGDAGELMLDRVNIKLHIRIKPVFGADTEILIRDIKMYIKKYVESINDGGTNSIYISNLIQSLENDFPDMKYMKFAGINDFDTSIQVIDNRTVNLEDLTKEERIDYVPEYLTISLEDIIIDVI